jgi:hypothetical protein
MLVTAIIVEDTLITEIRYARNALIIFQDAKFVLAPLCASNAWQAMYLVTKLSHVDVILDITWLQAYV